MDLQQRLGIRPTTRKSPETATATASSIPFDQETNTAAATTDTTAASGHTTLFQAFQNLPTTSNAFETPTRNALNYAKNNNNEVSFNTHCCQETKAAMDDVNDNETAENEKLAQEQQPIFQIWCEQAAGISPIKSDETEILPKITRLSHTDNDDADWGVTKRMAHTFRCILETFEATAKTTRNSSHLQYTCYNTAMADYLYYPSNSTFRPSSDNYNKLSSFTQGPQHQSQFVNETERAEMLSANVSNSNNSRISTNTILPLFSQEQQLQPPTTTSPTTTNTILEKCTAYIKLKVEDFLEPITEFQMTYKSCFHQKQKQGQLFPLSNAAQTSTPDNYLNLTSSIINSSIISPTNIQTLPKLCQTEVQNLSIYC